MRLETMKIWRTFAMTGFTSCVTLTPKLIRSKLHHTQLSKGQFENGEMHDIMFCTMNLILSQKWGKKRNSGERQGTRE